MAEERQSVKVERQSKRERRKSPHISAAATSRCSDGREGKATA